MSRRTVQFRHLKKDKASDTAAAIEATVNAGVRSKPRPVMRQRLGPDGKIHSIPGTRQATCRGISAEKANRLANAMHKQRT